MHPPPMPGFLMTFCILIDSVFASLTLLLRLALGSWTQVIHLPQTPKGLGLWQVLPHQASPLFFEVRLCAGPFLIWLWHILEWVHLKDQGKIINGAWFFEGKGEEEGEEEKEGRKEVEEEGKMRRKKESNGSPKADNCALIWRIFFFFFTRFCTLMCRDCHSHLRGRRPTSGPNQHLCNVITLLWSLPWLLRVSASYGVWIKSTRICSHQHRPFPPGVRLPFPALPTPQWLNNFQHSNSLWPWRKW